MWYRYQTSFLKYILSSETHLTPRVLDEGLRLLLGLSEVGFRTWDKWP
jgi:hypothetical protein